VGTVYILGARCLLLKSMCKIKKNQHHLDLNKAQKLTLALKLRSSYFLKITKKLLTTDVCLARKLKSQTSQVKALMIFTDTSLCD
jgi:hypothetical protein